jgi:uncharacterized membrane protein YsdA (DUF1294 family)
MPLHLDSRLLIEWVALVSLVGFVAMGIDKALAVGRRSRISERTLWTAALLGGFPGVFIGGSVFHHKTSKMEFWGPVVTSAIVWMVAIVLLVGGLP